MKKLLILILSTLTGTFACAQKIKVNIKSDAVCFLEGKDSILKYQIAEKSFNGSYKRTNYIHPLYTLDGEILTEDFPKDHLHHRGVFWAWHQLYIGNKRMGDAWEIKDFKWEVKSITEIEQPDNTKAIQAEIVWKSQFWLDKNGNEKPMVREVTTIKVYPLIDENRYIDIQISILALEPRMRIGGSQDEKGYGGFSQRVKLVDDIIFTSPKGWVKADKFPVKAKGWLDISGSFNKGGEISGLTILSHPNNLGYPNPWILRSKNSMQNAVYPFPGAKAVPLSDKEPTIMRYRLLVHNRIANAEKIKSIYHNYKSIKVQSFK